MKKMDTVKDRLPKVSFIIPTLNAAPFLDSCLRAIRGQDYPADKIEIVIADAFSTDKTREIGRQYQAKIIDNPEILHEPGKTLGNAAATGELLFYTDADNTLATDQWLRLMVAPYLAEKGVVGFLPQTVPAPDSSSLNRYLSYLFTDPLTWFIYGAAANPHDYPQIFSPTVETEAYKVYKFSPEKHPLFGLSQGSGVAATFTRGGKGAADDILSGIQIIEQGGLVVYVPGAGVYHYHVRGLADFLKKYRWRVRNNFSQKVKGMGMMNRLNFFDRGKKLRLALFIPYSLCLILPLLDSIRLALKWQDPVMLWHLPACITLSFVIIGELIGKGLGLNQKLGTYGK